MTVGIAMGIAFEIAVVLQRDFGVLSLCRPMATTIANPIPNPMPTPKLAADFARGLSWFLP
jgi:hypothetical protein